VLDKINKARNSTLKMLSHPIDDVSQNISTIAVKQFMQSTDGFEKNSCLDSKEESFTDIYTYHNCYYQISVDIIQKIIGKFPSTSVIVGETSNFSNYNHGGMRLVTFNLGPITIYIRFE